MLRLAGKGSAGAGSGANGDLFLTVKVAKHAEFQRKGNDLYRDLPVNLYTAIFGGKIPVKTLKGTIKVDIPKECQSGKVLRLKGLGMPDHNQQNKYGDLYLKIHVQVPTNLSKEELELFKKLREKRDST